MKIKTRIIYAFNRALKYLRLLNIKSSQESIEHLLSTSDSLVRYGDGELNIIMGGGIHFQEFNPILRQRLIDILKDNNTIGLQIGIPISINTTEGYSKQVADFWNFNMSTGRFHWLKLCNHKKRYLNSCFTWCFTNQENKNEAAHCFSKILNL